MNVVYWIGVQSTDSNLSEKHGNYDYFQYSKATWEYWCAKNNVVFYEYSKPSLDDTQAHKVTWQRWFDLEAQLSNLDWTKVAVVDASYMIKWDCPNFFELTSKELNTFQSLENINWIAEGIEGYQQLISYPQFDLKRYIDCGFQIFTKKHLHFLKQLQSFYLENYERICILQKEISRGTDQPIYNLLLQKYGVNFEFGLPNSYNLNHMNRFNWLSYNWQLNEDQTPYFVKYGNIWKFSGFDRRQRGPLMSQTWNLIKRNYNG